jgi:hypothetical protein
LAARGIVQFHMGKVQLRIVRWKQGIVALLVSALAGCFGNILERVDVDVRRLHAKPIITLTFNSTPIESSIYSHDFGTKTADGDGGAFSTEAIFTVTNTGTGDLAVSSIALSEGSISDFDVTNSVPQTLPPSAYGSFAVRFDPLATGAKSAVLTITSDDPATPAFTFTVTGTGTGIPVPDIAVKNGGTAIPSGTGIVDLGYERISGSGAVIPLSIENNGTADLSITGPDLVTVNPLDAGFSISQQPSATIASYTSAPFQIRFTPLSIGTKTATISIGSNDPDSPTYTFGVSGIGVAKLTASDGIASDALGESVWISGSVAIVGAPRFSGPGSAYIYRWNGAVWVQEQKLTASDGSSGDMFGLSVGISGSYAVVGAPYHKVGSNSGQGSAYVFYYGGSSWSQQAELNAGDGAVSDNFGTSAAISGDNIIVGAPRDSTDPTISHGAAYVFLRSGTTWPQKTKLLAADKASGDQFGSAVAISGNYAVVGAPYRSDAGSSSGAIYAFWYSGISWGAGVKLVAPDGAASDFFGGSVAAYQCFYVIGATGDDDKGSGSGSVYLYWQNPDTMEMIPKGKLTAPDGSADDAFGRSVARSGDYIVVGADLADGRAGDSGKVYVYADVGGYPCIARPIMNDGSFSDWFGHSVAVDGSNAICGAVYDDDKASDAGAAYIISIP